MAEEFDEAHWRATTIACDGQPIGDRNPEMVRSHAYSRMPPGAPYYENVDGPSYVKLCVCGQCECEEVDLTPLDPLFFGGGFAKW